MAVGPTSSTNSLTRTAAPSVTTCSIAGWFRTPASVVDYHYPLVIVYATDHRGIYLGFKEDSATLSGRMFVRDYGSSDVFLDFGISAAASTWYFFGVSRAAGTNNFKGYLARVTDAALIAVQGTPGTATTSQNRIGMGDDFWGDDCPSTIAALKIWDGVALTQAEIEQERWYYTPQRTDGLYLWSPFNDQDATNFRDYSGNGRHWTEAGTVAANADGPPILWGPAKRSRIWIPAGGGAQQTPVSASHVGAQEGLSSVAASKAGADEGVAQIARSIVASDEALASVWVARTAAQEANISVSASTVSPDEALQGVSASRASAQEAGGPVAASRVSAQEARAQVSATRTSAQEAKAIVSAETVGAQEARAPVAQTVAGAQESRAPVAASRVGSQEARSPVSQSLVGADEALQSVLAAIETADEALQAIARSLVSAQEGWGEQAPEETPISVSYVCAQEATGLVASERTSAHEARGLLAPERTGAQEGLASVSASRTSADEALQMVDPGYVFRESCEPADGTDETWTLMGVETAGTFVTFGAAAPGDWPAGDGARLCHVKHTSGDALVVRNRSGGYIDAGEVTALYQFVQFPTTLLPSFLRIYRPGVGSYMTWYVNSSGNLRFYRRRWDGSFGEVYTYTAALNERVRLTTRWHAKARWYQLAVNGTTVYTGSDLDSAYPPSNVEVGFNNATVGFNAEMYADSIELLRYRGISGQEALGYVASPGVVPHEARGLLTPAYPCAHEARAPVAASRAAAYEALQGVGQSFLTPDEALQYLSAPIRMPLEGWGSILKTIHDIDLFFCRVRAEDFIFSLTRDEDLIFARTREIDLEF